MTYESVKTTHDSGTSRSANQFIKSLSPVQSNHGLTNDAIFQIASFLFFILFFNYPEIIIIFYF